MDIPRPCVSIQKCEQAQYNEKHPDQQSLLWEYESDETHSFPQTES